jgi:hypothetical protein
MKRGGIFLLLKDNLYASALPQNVVSLIIWVCILIVATRLQRFLSHKSQIFVVEQSPIADISSYRHNLTNSQNGLRRLRLPREACRAG